MNLVFNKGQNNYQWNIFLEKCSYKQYKYPIMIELTFLKELKLIKKSVSKECDSLSVFFRWRV